MWGENRHLSIKVTCTCSSLLCNLQAYIKDARYAGWCVPLILLLIVQTIKKKSMVPSTEQVFWQIGQDTSKKSWKSWNCTKRLSVVSVLDVNDNFHHWVPLGCKLCSLMKTIFFSLIYNNKSLKGTSTLTTQ